MSILSEESRSSISWFILWINSLSSLLSDSVMTAALLLMAALALKWFARLRHDVPLDKVQDFERSFIESLQLNHQEDVLDVLKTGVIDDNVIKAIEETAAMVTKQFI